MKTIFSFGFFLALFSSSVPGHAMPAFEKNYMERLENRFDRARNLFQSQKTLPEPVRLSYGLGALSGAGVGVMSSAVEWELPRFLPRWDFAGIGNKNPVARGALGGMAALSSLMMASRPGTSPWTAWGVGSISMGLAGAFVQGFREALHPEHGFRIRPGYSVFDAGLVFVRRAGINWARHSVPCMALAGAASGAALLAGVGLPQ